MFKTLDISGLEAISGQAEAATKDNLTEREKVSVGSDHHPLVSGHNRSSRSENVVHSEKNSARTNKKEQRG